MGRYEAETPNRVIQSPLSRKVLYAVVALGSIAAILATLVTMDIVALDTIHAWGRTFVELLPWLVSLGTAVLAVVNVPKREDGSTPVEPTE